MLPICLSAVYLLAIPPSVFLAVIHFGYPSVRYFLGFPTIGLVCLFGYPSVRLLALLQSVCLFGSSSVFLAVCLFSCLFVCLIDCPSIWLSVHLSVSFASVCLFDCPLAVLDVCPFVCLFGRLFVKWRGQNSTTLSSFLEKILKHCQQVIQSKVCYFVKK